MVCGKTEKKISRYQKHHKNKLERIDLLRALTCEEINYVCHVAFENLNSRISHVNLKTFTIQSNWIVNEY